jgi:putative component of toxin-antitoxin plasmid stabilization module
VVQLRAGGSSNQIGIGQKLAAFFLGKSKPSPRPQRQCPAPDFGPRFALGSGSNSPWGNSDPDPCQQAVPPRNQWNSDKEFYRYDSNQEKKEDQTPIQGECRPRVLKSRINEDEGLINAAKKACKNQQVQDDINAMEESIRQGNMNPGIGSKPVGEGITEFRGKNGGRILARESEDGVVEILGKSGKKPKNQQYVIKQVKKVFPKNQK